MIRKDTDDGGYYGMKGYGYQIDKTICEALDNPHEDIYCEYCQDIHYGKTVIQVKYHESQTYKPSLIREPIVKLLELFSDDESLECYLCCYFKDKPTEYRSIDIAELNKILGKKIFNENVKKKFISKFKIRFSENFDASFEDTIKKIKTNFNCSPQAALIKHGVITDYILQTIYTNPENKRENRRISEQSLRDVSEHATKYIFYSEYRTLLGEEKYIKMIKREYFIWYNISNFERFIIITIPHNEKFADIKKICIFLRDKFCIIRKRAVKSGAPFLFFKGIKTDKLKGLKTELMNEGIILKDGHDFLDADFSIQSLKEDTSMQNRIMLKILNTADNFDSMIKEEFGKSKEIYQFFFDKPFQIDLDIKHIQIHIRKLSDICKIM